jgi:hypothetical protein
MIETILHMLQTFTWGLFSFLVVREVVLRA